MDFDLSKTLDSIKDGTKEIAEVTHEKTSEFHDQYISKVIPDCGKYGEAATFAAEMVPGVAEYNAIREGDWQAFAIAAGVDIAAVAIGCFTAGAGYAAVKGGKAAAKAGVKIATREVAEAGAKKVVKEVAETGVKKVVKEVAESGTEKAVKEVAEAGVEKATKEVAEKVAKETVEAGAEKVAKETVEAGAEKVAKETVEAGAEKAAKETVEAGTEKIAQEGTEKVVKTTKEIGEKMDKSLIPDYLDEVEKITGREIPANQMEKLESILKENDFVKLDPEKTELNRRLFDNAREKLIKEWEINTGQTWPTYTEDLVNEAGKVLRTAGQKFDAHHIIELNFSGPNSWWNLHPAMYGIEHQGGIHAAGSLANIIF